MNSHPPSRRAVNVGSLLLTPQENECLFGYLGRKCATLCSAVVQVYVADRSYNWVKRGCGVACLVKDNPQRSYFIRVFDIKCHNRDRRWMYPDKQMSNSVNWQL